MLTSLAAVWECELGDLQKWRYVQMEWNRMNDEIERDDRFNNQLLVMSALIYIALARSEMDQ
jgi:hypothetical protein